MAASEDNLADARRYMNYQTIGHDKLNQLRHVRFFKDMDGMREHMRKHAAILRPKFEAVLSVWRSVAGADQREDISFPLMHFLDVQKRL